MEEVVRERLTALSAIHISDKSRPACVSGSRLTSSVIANNMAEAWQATCFSHSSKSDSKSAYSLSVLSLVLLPHFFSSNFYNCSSHKESASFYADYLIFHFSVSQPKVLCSKTKNYLSELRRATSPFCSMRCSISPMRSLIPLSALVSL